MTGSWRMTPVGLIWAFLAAAGLGLPEIRDRRRGRPRAKPYTRPTDREARVTARPGRWRYVKALVGRPPGRPSSPAEARQVEAFARTHPTWRPAGWVGR